MDQVTYNSSLSLSSPPFYLADASVGYFFYQALQVNVPQSGMYMFTCSSSIETHGLFYNDTFDSFYLLVDLIELNDGSGGYLQFDITVDLSAGSINVLLVAAYHANMLGSFSIKAFGPSLVSLIAFTPSTSNTGKRIILHNRATTNEQLPVK
jgi:hypothetical protein